MPRIERKSIAQNFVISSIAPFENSGAASSGAVVVQKSVKLIDHPKKETGIVNFGSAAEVGTMQNIEEGTKVILFGRQDSGSSASTDQDRFFYLNKKYPGSSDITVSITAICGDNGTNPSVTRQGGGTVTLSTPEDSQNDVLELQHSVDGTTWTTFRIVRPHDAGDGARDLTFSEFRTITTTFVPPSGQDVYIRVNQKNWAGNTHDHYAIKSLVVYSGRLSSGFTTLNPKIVQIIHDNSESDSYVSQNLGIKNRRNISNSLRSPAFDDQKELRPASRNRKEVITIPVRTVHNLIDNCKVYIRGADGLAMKSYAFVSSDRDDNISFVGGLDASDTKINIREEIKKLPFSLRRKRASIARAVASSLANAIEADKSLKLKVYASDNKVYLEDQHVESSAYSTYFPVGSEITPPRALQHPIASISFSNASHTNLANTEEGRTITIVDAQGLKKVYAFVNSSQTSMTTGTVIDTGDDIGFGGASSTLKGAIAVAVNISSTTSLAAIAELKVAINHENGHGNRVIVSDPWVNASNYTLHAIISAVPPLREGQGISVTENTNSFQASGIGPGSANQRTMKASTGGVLLNGAPTANSSVNIRTKASTGMIRYVACRTDGSVKTGDKLKSGDIVDGPGTAVTGTNIGGVAVVADSQTIFKTELIKAIHSKNGHAGKVSAEIAQTGESIHVRFIDNTSSSHIFNGGLQSITVTGSGFAAVSNWTGSSGGKIVEAIHGHTKVKNSLKIEVVSYGGLSTKTRAGLNYIDTEYAKNTAVKSHRSPDIQISAPVRHSSGYMEEYTLPDEGSANPFKEVGLYESFQGETGPNVNPDHSYVARQNEFSLTSKFAGADFEGSLSSKEVIEIELDASGGDITTLYGFGTGDQDMDRPTMAYLSKTGQWTALGQELPHDARFPGRSSGNRIGETVSYLRNQIAERSLVGFSQGTKLLIAKIGNPTYIDASSLELDAERLETERNKLAFVEGAPNSCINSFGFPSHPKFSPSENLKFDVSDYIDEDFLVENIVIDCELNVSGGDIQGALLSQLNDTSEMYPAAELSPHGLTFFVLNERKALVDDQISKVANQIEIDLDTGGVNEISRTTSARNFSIPGWYPTGKRQAWGASYNPGGGVNTPNSAIYTVGTSAATVNNSSYSTSNGWSFWQFGGSNNGDVTVVTDSDLSNDVIEAGILFIATSNTNKVNPFSEKTSDHTTSDAKPPSSIPLSEGYSTTSYLSSDRAYRLRFHARVKFADSNANQVPDILEGDIGPGFKSGLYTRANFINVYASYHDSIEKGDADGVRVLVASQDLSDDWEWYDIPIRTEYGSVGRKFNLLIEVYSTAALVDDPGDKVRISAMEIYRAEESRYVDTIRDVVGWGTLGVFPEEFSKLMSSRVSDLVPDIRRRYSTVIESDVSVQDRFVTRFPAKTPVPAVAGSVARTRFNSDAMTNDLIVENWDSIGRSGIEGVATSRSPVSVVPGIKPSYVTKQYGTNLRVPIAESNSRTSPYILKKGDSLIIGAQSLVNYSMHATENTHARVDILPGKVRVKIYGSRLSQGRVVNKDQSDALSSNSIHEAVGAGPVLDQVENYTRTDLHGTYLDNILYGDPKLTNFIRGGEIARLGIGRNFNKSMSGLHSYQYALAGGGGVSIKLVRSDPAPIGRKDDPGFGKYGDFLGFCPTIFFKGTSASAADGSWVTRSITIEDLRSGRTKTYLFTTAGSTGDDLGSNQVAVTVAANSPITFKVDELEKAVRHANGHSAAVGALIPFHVESIPFDTDYIDVTDSNGDGWPDSGDRVHAFQIVPRISSRAEADLFDEALGDHGLDSADLNPFVKVTLSSGFISSGDAVVQQKPEYKSYSSSSTSVFRHVPGLARHYNMLRKDRVFNRGIVCRASEGTSGITGSLQPFVSLVDQEHVRYDSLVPPVYEFLKKFDVKVAPSGDAGSVGGFISGSFLPIFQRCQVINQSGSACTGRGAFPFTPAYEEPPGLTGYDKNIRNLWSRWINERGDLSRTTDPTNPETFRVDSATFNVALAGGNPNEFKEALPIARVQVADMNRFGSDIFTGRDNVGGTQHPGHYTGSLTGFGRLTGDNRHDGSPSSLPRVRAETQFSGSFRTNAAGNGAVTVFGLTNMFSPQLNKSVAMQTLKSLYGFETSFYSRTGNTANQRHDVNNGAVEVNLGQPQFAGFRFSSFLSPNSAPTDFHGARLTRAEVVVRGMRYGIDNYIPTSNTVKIRFNRYGQFRDMLEQRLFSVESSRGSGEINPDRPIEVVYMSRPAYDELGNISSVRKRAVPAIETNSQNLSNYATSSFPYFDEWDEAVPTQYKFGRDRSSSLPDDNAVTVVTEVS